MGGARSFKGARSRCFDEDEILSEEEERLFAEPDSDFAEVAVVLSLPPLRRISIDHRFPLLFAAASGLRDESLLMLLVVFVFLDGDFPRIFHRFEDIFGGPLRFSSR